MSDEELPDDSWMVRPCEHYLEEFKDCSGWRGRFHEKFIHGHVLSNACQKWKEDYDNCIRFRKSRSPEILERIVDNEKERREARLAAAHANDVWEYRSSPPADWASPLPEHMKKNTLPNIEGGTTALCVIS